MVLLVLGVIGFMVWTASVKEEPAIVYTPPAVTADDPLSEGRSTKELYQDYKILEAGIKRADGYKSTAAKALNDQPQAIGDSGTATTVEQSRLSELQTDFISEVDRRIKALNELAPQYEKLTAAQRPVIEAAVNKEITDLNSMKARVAATDNPDAFAADRQLLNAEYNAYLLAIVQTTLLVFADDQAALESKVNRIGGKFQERINEASSAGKATATAQAALNSYQANKTTATGLTADVIKVVPTIRPGEHNSNRAVLKTYYDKLSTAHNELTKALDSTKKLYTETQKFDS
jgi:hypothetical protein